MAVWIKAIEGSQTVMPANGKAFKLAELQSMVGGYIEAVRLDGDLIMFVNEEGKFKGLPYNSAASFMASVLARITDPIVGDVVIGTRIESGEDDEDEGGDE